MSQIIGGLFAVMTLIIAGVVFFGANLSSASTWNYVLEQEANRLADRVRTVVTIDSVESVLEENEQVSVLHATVQNRGATSVDRFEGMHILVLYTDTSGQEVINRLIYVDHSLSSTNQWSIQSILPDTFEPGILNPGERAILRLVLEPTANLGTYGTLHISTNNGVTTSGVFLNLPAM